MMQATQTKGDSTPKQTTRLKLLAAAEQVILAEGLTALTVRRVGDVSGQNPTLITYHFGTMGKLLDELCELNLAPMRRAWADMDGSATADPRALLRRWLEPLLAPAAFVPHGRALVLLDEIASHGDEAMRQRLFTEMAGVARRLRQSLAPHLPGLPEAELQARVRYISGAALGPPPRSRSLESADRLAELDTLTRFAAAGLELPPQAG